MNTLASITAVLFCILAVLISILAVTSSVEDLGYTEFTFTNTSPPDSMYIAEDPTPTPSLLKQEEARISKHWEDMKEYYNKQTPTPAPITHDYITNASEAYFLFNNTPVPGCLWDENRYINYVGVSHGSIVSLQPITYNFGEIESATITFKGVMKIDRMYFTDEGTVLEMKR